jgi:hypothetical protein
MPTRIQSFAATPNTAALKAFLGVLKDAWDAWNTTHLFVAYFQVYTTIIISVNNRFKQV